MSALLALFMWRYERHAFGWAYYRHRRTGAVKAWRYARR